MTQSGEHTKLCQSLCELIGALCNLNYVLNCFAVTQRRIRIQQLTGDPFQESDWDHSPRTGQGRASKSSSEAPGPAARPCSGAQGWGLCFIAHPGDPGSAVVTKLCSLWLQTPLELSQPMQDQLEWLGRVCRNHKAGSSGLESCSPKFRQPEQRGPSRL